MKRRLTTSVNQGHNTAFLIEMMAIVVILFVILGISARLLVGSTLSVHESSHRNAAISQATLIAETFEQAESERAFSEAIDGTLDEQAHSITTQPVSVSPYCSTTIYSSIETTREPTETGVMADAQISVIDADTHEVLYTLHDSHFISNTGGGTL